MYLITIDYYFSRTHLQQIQSFQVEIISKKFFDILLNSITDINFRWIQV